MTTCSQGVCVFAKVLPGARSLLTVRAALQSQCDGTAGPLDGVMQQASSHFCASSAAMTTGSFYRRERRSA